MFFSFLGRVLNLFFLNSNALEVTAKELDDEYKAGSWYDVVGPVVNILDSILLPVILVLGIAGLIFSIVLGVQYANADGDKKESAKKRLINAVIGLIIALVILIAMKIFTAQAPNIAAYILEQAGE